MTPQTVYQRFRKKHITTVTRLEYDNLVYLYINHISHIEETDLSAVYSIMQFVILRLKSCNSVVITSITIKNGNLARDSMQILDVLDVDAHSVIHT